MKVFWEVYGLSSSNPFVKARIPLSDALVAASILALSAKKRTFTAREIVDLVRKAGDSRSESTIQNKVRVLLRSLVGLIFLMCFRLRVGGRYMILLLVRRILRGMPS